MNTGNVIGIIGIALCVLLCGIGSSIGLYKTGTAAAPWKKPVIKPETAIGITAPNSVQPCATVAMSPSEDEAIIPIIKP